MLSVISLYYPPARQERHRAGSSTVKATVFYSLVATRCHTELSPVRDFGEPYPNGFVSFPLLSPRTSCFPCALVCFSCYNYSTMNDEPNNTAPGCLLMFIAWLLLQILYFTCYPR
jgi:hypothetical protein